MNVFKWTLPLRGFNLDFCSEGEVGLDGLSGPIQISSRAGQTILSPELNQEMVFLSPYRVEELHTQDEISRSEGETQSLKSPTEHRLALGDQTLEKGLYGGRGRENLKYKAEKFP